METVTNIVYCYNWSVHFFSNVFGNVVLYNLWKKQSLLFHLKNILNGPLNNSTPNVNKPISVGFIWVKYIKIFAAAEYLTQLGLSCSYNKYS